LKAEKSGEKPEQETRTSGLGVLLRFWLKRGTDRKRSADGAQSAWFAGAHRKGCGESYASLYAAIHAAQRFKW
jgi:hypothetical protein